MNARLILEACPFCFTQIVFVQKGRRQRIRLGLNAQLHLMTHHIMPFQMSGTASGRRIWARWSE